MLDLSLTASYTDPIHLCILHLEEDIVPVLIGQSFAMVSLCIMKHVFLQSYIHVQLSYMKYVEAVLKVG